MRKQIKYSFSFVPVWTILLLLIIVGCKKPEIRNCLKFNGNYAEREVALDSVRFFHLNKNLKYRIFQDNERKVVIKGGENLINLIETDVRDNILYVDNRNTCNFLRDAREKVEVEIHYPHLHSFYIDPTDSVVFENTIVSDFLGIEMRNGGGSVLLDVDVKKISMVVSRGAADYTLSGRADEAELKVQNNGSANAIGFNSEYVFIYQNSTADFFIDLNGSSAVIIVDGTGDVYYNYTPANIDAEGLGQGQIIKL